MEGVTEGDERCELCVNGGSATIPNYSDDSGQSQHQKESPKTRAVIREGQYNVLNGGGRRTLPNAIPLEAVDYLLEPLQVQRRV